MDPAHAVDIPRATRAKLKQVVFMAMIPFVD
jgi:hypothetical protein